MKQFSMPFLLALLLALHAPAFAGELSALVIDRDTNGTNVRDRPAGRIIDVIPYAPRNAADALLERRVVTIVRQKGTWLLVEYDGSRTGWMHRSVLGFCAVPSEDGGAVLKSAPHPLQDAGSPVARVPDNARLVLAGDIDLKTEPGWARVEYVDARGRRISGWLSEQNLSANPYNDCWR